MNLYVGGYVPVSTRLQFHSLYHRPPTEDEVMRGLVDSGLQADMVVNTLGMDDPAKCSEHMGFHPRVALGLLP